MENKRLNIVFLHDWEHPLNELLDNDDGLPAAVAEISRNHSLIWITRGQPLTFMHHGYTIHSVPSDASLLSIVGAHSPDVIIAWGSLDRPWHQLIHDQFKSTPKVLCFAGGPTAHIAKSYFRVIVCESQVYLDAFTKTGVTAVRGFGTNVRTFFHERRLPKVWDAIYPASLCFHKNIELFARAMGDRGICVGNHNEPTVASKVLSLGTALLHRVSSTTLCDLYNMSRVTVVTAGPQGGAQRVVLESMSCGVPVVVMSDHDRCIEFVEESHFGLVVHPVDIDIRDAVNRLIAVPLDPSIGTAYINSKWTESHYAEAILSACRTAMLN